MRRLALVAVLAIGCGEEPRDPCDFHVCSIQSEACVEAVAETVACQRNVDPLVPQVRFLTRDEVLQEWTAEPATPEETERQRQWAAAEALIGLSPPNYEPSQATADSLENVAAFYRRDQGDVTIISDSGVDNPTDGYVILVHEMVHVYQDAVYDLASLSEAHATTGDRSLGLRAAIEGDANMYASFAAIASLGFTPDTVDWGRYFADFQTAMLELAQMSETPSVDVITLFPYAWGEAYQYPAWRRLDTEGPGSVLLDPPDSVRQTMRGYLIEERSDINEDALLDPVAVPVLPGFAFIGGDHYSTWLVNAMLQRTGASTELIVPELDSIGADYYSAFRHEASGVPAMVWRIRGGMSLSARLEASSWNAGDPTRSQQAVDGDLVLVAVGEGLDAATVFQTISSWQSPSAAYEAAGLDESPRRQHPIGCPAP